jgi:AcrR family transcriptional regulator
LSRVGQENVRQTTRFCLIDALLAVWAEAPAESISVRTLVRKADAAQSAIHYHFGDMERLYQEASQVALAAAQDWMAVRLKAMSGLAVAPVPRALQIAILTASIADWVTSQRPLAMAARHAPSSAWHRAWDDFWSQLALILGLEAHATKLALFAEGESARHLMTWNPVLDRALLDETVTALLLWLEERRFGPEDIRLRHRALARENYDSSPSLDDGMARMIAEAAADLLADDGHAGVTFRAVAHRAGVTLGSVIHHCGTKSELLRGALHHLYLREAMGGGPEILAAHTYPPAAMLDRLLASIVGGSQPVLRAFDEIELAIYNSSEFNALRGVVRSMDDPSGAWALQQMLGGTAPPTSLVAAFSAIIRGIGFRARLGGPEARMLEATARQSLMAFLSADQSAII